MSKKTIMHKPTAPCLGCPDRIVGCHIKCAKYNVFVRKAEIWRKYIQQQKLTEIYRRELSVEFERNRRRR